MNTIHTIELLLNYGNFREKFFFVFYSNLGLTMTSMKPRTFLVDVLFNGHKKCHQSL